MRMRMVALVAGWSAACLITTSVGWLAVDLVGNEVAPSGPEALSQAEVERRIHQLPGPSTAGAGSTVASTRSASPAISDPPPATGASPPAIGASSTPTRRSFSAVGGTVVLTCDGTRPSLRSAPRPGFDVSESPEADGSKIKVSFSDGTRRSRVEGSCAGGVPTAQVRETTGSESDD
jgi:hypothetical protein